MAAAVAYHTIFAIPPLIILTVALAGLLNSVTSISVVENLRQLIRDRAPANTTALLNDLVDHAIAKVGGGGASIGVLLTAALALWSGSNAVSSLIESFNRAYEVDETRGWRRLKPLALGLTLAIAVFVNLAFVLLIFGQRIGQWLADRVGLGSTFTTVWGVGRAVLAVAAVLFVLSLLYGYGPNLDRPYRWITLGSIAATLLWLAAVAGFGLFLRVANPGQTYGAVGSVIVLLVFLNLTAVIFLLGAEIDALTASRRTSAEPPEAPAT